MSLANGLKTIETLPKQGGYKSMMSLHSKTTAVIQIGNTDKKLDDEQWRSFIACVHETIHQMYPYVSQVHFAGSAADPQYTNFCWVIEMQKTWVPYLRQQLALIAHNFKQDSIALVVGDVEFIKAKAP